jgi:hypothetical protein
VDDPDVAGLELPQLAAMQELLPRLVFIVRTKTLIFESSARI